LVDVTAGLWTLVYGEVCFTVIMIKMSFVLRSKRANFDKKEHYTFYGVGCSRAGVARKGVFGVYWWGVRPVNSGHRPWWKYVCGGLCTRGVNFHLCVFKSLFLKKKSAQKKFGYHIGFWKILRVRKHIHVRLGKIPDLPIFSGDKLVAFIERHTNGWRRDSLPNNIDTGKNNKEVCRNLKKMAWIIIIPLSSIALRFML